MRPKKFASIPKSLRELPQDMPWDDFAWRRPEIASAIAKSMGLEWWEGFVCHVGFDDLSRAPGEDEIFAILGLGDERGQSSRVVALRNLAEAAMRDAEGGAAFYALSGRGLAWAAVLSEGDGGSWLVLHHRE